MNPEQQKNCEILRSMDSKEAADWLLDVYRPSGPCFYVGKRSWKKAEQIRLAEYFLASIPHATDSCYKSLLSVMTVPTFVGVALTIIKNLKQNDFELLTYYLLGSVNDACNKQKDFDAFNVLKEHLKCA